MDMAGAVAWGSAIGGIGGSITVLVNVWKWFQIKRRDTRETAELGAALAATLLNQATSPAKRADIHAYIQFQHTRWEANNLRRNIWLVASWSLLLFLSCGMELSYRILDVLQMPWLWYSALGALGLSFVVLAATTFINLQLRQMEAGWIDSAENVLRNRAIKHFPSSENST